MKELNFKILNQGGPIANHGWIISQNDEIAAVTIDFASKRCEIIATGSGNEDSCPTIYIQGGEYGLHLLKGLEKEPTEISFTDFPNYDILCSEFSRYSLYVTLVKKGIW